MCEEQEILKDAWLACAVSAPVPGNKLKISRCFSSPPEAWLACLSQFGFFCSSVFFCIRISFCVEVRDIN